MNINDILLVMCAGNPGAVNVCMQLIQKGKKVDQDLAGDNGFLHILNLDSFGIYGHRIWMLYKYVCEQDINKVVVLLRARQLGHLSGKTLNHAIDNRGDGIIFDELVDKIKEELPNFNMEV